MSLISKIIKKSFEEKCAFGTFNTSNLEVAQAISAAAEKKCAPAMIGVTETALKYAGFLPLINLVKGIIKESRADLVLHLDHGKNPVLVKKCIDIGFESVMIDASSKKLEDNIQITKHIVDYAHKKGVVVQAEIGRIPRVFVDNSKKEETVSFFESGKTNPEEAERFVKETKIDTLAVMIGNVHGMYKTRENPNLDFELLEKIRERVLVPFVLHGGSGTPISDIKKAVKKYGIVNVNIDTEIRTAFIKAMKEFFDIGRSATDPREILSFVKKEVQKKIEEKMEIFM